MKIILEGADNSGKTTLANLIIDRIGDFDLYHHPGGKPTDEDAEFECIRQQMEWLHADNVIIDRVTPISQRIYNPNLLLDKKRANAWSEMDRQHQPILIYCRPSTDRLLRIQDFTWRDGETDEHKHKIIENQHRFVERYDTLLTNIPCVHYDFDEKISASLIVRQAINGMLGDTSAIGWFHKHMHNWRDS